MAKRKQSLNLLNLIAWVTGVLVSLVVGSGMIGEGLGRAILGLPRWLGGATLVGEWVVLVAGWIVVVTTLIGAALAILKR